MELTINEIILISIFVLAAGACIGSFLNVAALRAISGESIVFPASKCPLCGEPIKWYDNIPVLSYFFTIKGKCRNCGGKVSVQYPVVEASTALLFLVIFTAYGFTIKTLLLLILLSISIVIT
ncbi:MAG: prepilin peptidase, partial [Candidatus Gastranaerophilales bacterium]|nr:prepilin peptidase [Candidatus Gastranaerophilales bacterium]